MYYKLPLKQFTKTIQSVCNDKKSGILFFTEEDENNHWGKMILQHGIILSIGYKGHEDKMMWGEKTFPLVNSINTVKFFFKESSRKPAHSDPDLLSTKLTEKIFRFFGLENKTQEKPLEAPKTVPQETSASTKKKILIADDSAFVRKLIIKTLSSKNYELIEAKNGFEAFGQLNNAHPDLLLLDLIMPGNLDGYKVLDLIKKNDKFDHMPIIILTSRSSLLDKIKGKMSASDEYLTKPFEADDLLATIGKYI